MQLRAHEPKPNCDPQRRWRRLTTIGCVFALVVQLLAVDAVVATVAGAAESGPRVELHAVPGSPIAPDAVALIDVAIHNSGETNLAAPITVTTGGHPAGIDLVAAETSLTGRSWDCVSATCTLVGPDGSTPAVLDAFEVAQTRLRFSVAPGTSLPPSVEFTIVVDAGASDPPADLSEAAATVVLDRLDPAVPATLEVVTRASGLVAGKDATSVVRITNLGPSPIGGSGAVLDVVGALAPGSTGWVASGAGWTCEPRAGLPVCSWAGAQVGPGASVADLLFDFRAPPNPTAADAPLEWTQTTTHRPASGSSITDSAERVAAVLVDLPPAGQVFALPAARAAVERGGTIDIVAGVAGSGFDDDGREVSIVARLPNGWELEGATGPWTCAPVAQEVRCERTADFGGETESAATLTLAAALDAQPGIETIVFTGSISGPDTAAPTTDEVSIAVDVAGAPRSQLRVFHYPDGSTARHIVDGTPLAVVPGAAALLGIDFVNAGSDLAPAGSELSFSLELPAGTALVEVSGAKPKTWSCRTTSATGVSATATCTMRLATAVAPGAATPRAKLSIVVDDTAATGPQTWPLALAAQIDGAPAASMAASADIPAVVATPVVEAAALGVSASVADQPRATHPIGTMTVAVTNGGDAELSKGWSFSVDLPAELDKAEKKSLPEACKYKKGKKPKKGRSTSPRVDCTDKHALAPGASGPDIAIPVRFAPVAGPVELVVYTQADGADDVSTPITVVVLPALDAQASATPERVILPPDPSTSIPDVILDGRESVADGGAATWEQLFSAGDPAVTFTGSTESLVARFAPPHVTTETTLRFRLTLADEHSSDSAEVAVVIEPSSAPQPQSQSQPAPQTMAASPSARSTSFAASEPSASAAAAPGWSWTASGAREPAFSKNDVSSTIDFPIWNSRIRILDRGVFVWIGDDPAPTDATLAISWEQCDYDGNNCFEVGTGDVHLVGTSGANFDAVFTVSGTDSGGSTVTTTERFPMGVSEARFLTPVVIRPLTISGAARGGGSMLGTPGEWSLEWDHEYAWLACDGPDISTCSEIPGETELTMVVPAEHDGKPIRFQVTNAHPEVGRPGVAHTSALQWGVVVDCEPSCYTWSVPPAIEHTDIGEPFPVTSFPATVLDDGVYAWNHDSSPPEIETVSIRWWSCTEPDSTGCVSRSFDRSYAPTNPNQYLEAHVTVTGRHGVDGVDKRGTLVIPFGLVRDSTQPPVATTPPSISGNPFVGQVLTADPGVWERAPEDDRFYTWFRCDADDPDVCAPVPGSESTYTVRDEDLTENDSVMRVDVMAFGYRNHTRTTARSAPTGVISGNTKRLISPPTVDVGPDGLRFGVEVTSTHAVWTASPPTISGPDASWLRCGTTDSASCSLIWGATEQAYTPTDDDVGRYLRMRSSIVAEDGNGDPIPLLADSEPAGPVQAAPLVATTDLADGAASLANDEVLDVFGFANGGVEPYTFSWLQTSGTVVTNTGGNSQHLRIRAPSSGTGLLRFRFTVTDAAGETATTTITVEYGNTGAPPELCEAHELARQLSGSVKVLTYGDIRITFGPSNGTSNSEFCTPDTVVTITQAAITAYDLLSTFQVQVTINADGVFIDGDAYLSLATGTDLDGVAVRLVPGSSLSVPFDADDGSYELVGAVVGNQLLDMLRVGEIDAGAARLALGNADGVQSLTIEVLGWDDSHGPPTPVPGQLPDPPSGSPTVSLGGTISTNGTFSLELRTTGILEIAGAVIDFTGRVERLGTSGPLTFFAEGSLGSPLTLARNLVLESASLTWDGDTFGGAGELTFTTDTHPLRIDASFAFTHPKNWSATVAVDATLLAWEPVPGLTFESPVVTGSFFRTATSTRFDIDISAAEVSIGTGVLLTSPKLELDGLCNDGDCVYDLAFSTGLELAMYGDTLSAELRGALNTGTGAFSAEASIGAFDIVDGLRVDSASFRVERNDEGAFDIELTARVRVFDSDHALTITIDQNGALALIENGTWTPFEGAPTFENSWLIVASYDGTVRVNGEDVDVTARTLHISAQASVPRWFGNLIDDHSARADVTGSLRLSPFAFDFSIEFDFTDQLLFEVSGVRLVADKVTIDVSADGASFSTSVDAAGRLIVPTHNGGTSEVGVAAGLYYRPDTQTISGFIELEDRYGSWDNAFGVEGLQIQSFAVSVGISFAGVQLGFSGRATLPTAWEEIGIQPNTQVSLVASISGASSCFGFELSNAGGVHDAVDVANLGVLTAKEVSLYIAPTGCQVGRTVIKPGIAFAFIGAIFDTQVRVNMTVATTPDFLVEARIEIGTVDLGPLVVESTVVEVEISQTRQRLFFAASATVFDATADVSGEFLFENNALKIAFEGTFTTPDLGGFQLDELTVAFEYTSSSRQLAVDALVSVQVLEQSVMVDLSFEMLNGKVVAASGTGAIDITIDELNIIGTGSFAFAKGEFPTIAIDATATVDGHQLTSVRATLRDGSLEFEAELGRLGIFQAPPKLSGIVVWKSSSYASLPFIKNGAGDWVQAEEGDFRFQASNIGVQLPGFGVNGDVLIGRVGDTFFAEMALSLNFELDSHASADVDFRGQFSSDGTFELSGNGRMKIGGVQAIQLSFLIARTATAPLAITADASIDITNIGSVDVHGSFSKDATFGWLYALRGELDITVDGHEFGRGAFAAYREKQGRGAATGMEAGIAVDIPDLAKGHATAAIYSSGKVSFSANLRTQGALEDAVGDLRARVDFRSVNGATDYSFSISATDVLGLPASFTIAGSISSTGDFSVEVDFDIGPFTASANFFACDASVSASASLHLEVESAPRFRIEVEASGSVSARCGILHASASVTGGFTYLPPDDLQDLKIKAKFSFPGGPTWEPTLYKA